MKSYKDLVESLIKPTEEQIEEETHAELARQAAGKYRSALARGDSVAAAAANAEHHRHRKAAELARKKSHTPGIEEGVEIVQEGSDYNVTISHYVKGDDGKTTTTKHDYVIKNALSRKHAKNIAMNKHSAKVGYLKPGHSFGTDSMATTELHKEEVDLNEGKMGQIHADIEDHLGKHIADYKAHGGAEHFANKVMKTHEHIAKLHGLEKKHAAGLVNQYVDSHLKEETELQEGTQSHKVNVTVSDPNHTAVSMRKEKIEKRVVVSAADKGDAMAKAQAFYKKKGYKVHDVTHHSVVPKTTMKTEEVNLTEAKVTDLETYFDKIDMKGSVEKKPAVKKEPENTIKGSQVKFFNNFKEDVDLNEKMDLAKASMGDVIKDFRKSDAPQFAGKSKEKRQQMAIAAKLEADRQQNEGVIQPTGDDSIDTGADNKGKTTYTKDKSGKLVSFKHEGEWKKATKKDPRGTVTHMSDVAQRRAAQMANEEVEQVEEQAPVAPVPDRKYIKGTPEWKAHKEKSKPINGHPTVKEEAELEEAFINGREYASQGVMHPDHAKIHKVGNQTDFYAHGTGDKISGKVTHNDGKEVHFKADKSSGGDTHKFKVSSTLPKSVNEGLEESSDHDPYFTAQKHKSDAEKAHKAGDHKSYHMFMAAHHDSMAEWSAKRGRHHVAGQHEMKAQNHEDWANQTHKEEVSINDEGDFVVENKLSYGEFMSQLLEYTPGPGGVTRVQGRSYGAQYHDPEGDDDADDKPAKKAEPAAKRGRGRPAGSKSGANVKRLSSKGSNGYGYDSTGYKLHLPNSNK